MGQQCAMFRINKDGCDLTSSVCDFLLSNWMVFCVIYPDKTSSVLWSCGSAGNTPGEKVNITV